jgi:hypothetical protein
MRKLLCIFLVQNKLRGKRVSDTVNVYMYSFWNVSSYFKIFWEVFSSLSETIPSGSASGFEVP